MKITYVTDYHYFNSTIVEGKPTMVHVGVFDDESFIKFKKLYPEAVMKGYEADPKNFKAVKERVTSAGASLHNTAVTETEGRVKLNRYTNSVSHSIFKRTDQEFVDEVSVRSTTIGKILSKLGYIDVLILNCEGSEVGILVDILNNGLMDKIGQMCVSFHNSRIYPTYVRNNIEAQLSKLCHIVRCPRQQGVPDVLFIRKV